MGRAHYIPLNRLSSDLLEIVCNPRTACVSGVTGGNMPPGCTHPLPCVARHCSTCRRDSQPVAPDFPEERNPLIYCEIPMGSIPFTRSTVLSLRAARTILALGHSEARLVCHLPAGTVSASLCQPKWPQRTRERRRTGASVPLRREARHLAAIRARPAPVDAGTAWPVPRHKRNRASHHL